jgi:CrcB protein
VSAPAPASAFTLAGFVAVGVGAVLGAWARWGLSAWLNPGRSLPLGTLAANLLGGFLIGAAIAWLDRHPALDPVWRLFLVTGFLGALTTFSSFSAESFAMLQRGESFLAITHAGLHLAGSLFALAIGYRLAS